MADLIEIDFKDIVGEIWKYKDGDEIKFRPGVYCFVINNNNDEVLLIRGGNGAGDYEVSGGGLDLNENFIEGVIREVKEETGYDIEIYEKDPFYVAQSFEYFRSDKLFANSINIFL